MEKTRTKYNNWIVKTDTKIWLVMVPDTIPANKVKSSVLLGLSNQFPTIGFKIIEILKVEVEPCWDQKTNIIFAEGF